MTVQFSEIVSALQKLYPKSFISNQMEISQWRTLNKQQANFDSDCVYIGKSSILGNINSSVKANFILLEDIELPDHILKEGESNYIFLDEDNDLNNIIEEIHHIFKVNQKLGDYTIKILQACQKGSTIQQLLDIGHELLGNPILLVDLSLCFIAQSGGDNITNEPLWEWTLSKGYVTEEYVQSVMTPDLSLSGNEQFYTCGSMSNTFWNNKFVKHRQLVGRVAHDEVPMGYLKLLEFNKPITPLDEKTLDMLCNFIAITMKDPNITNNISNNLIDSFLIALLNQKIYDQDAIEERKHLFGLKLYENLFVVTVQPEKRSDINDHLYYMRRILQSFFNRQTILIHNSQIVVLFDTINKEMNENTMSLFEDLLKKNSCIAGISQSFIHLQELSEYHKQSIGALHMGEILHESKRIFKYKDYIISHMILHFHNETNIKNLVHPAVNTLKDLDEKKGTDFLKTLLTYINNNQNITLASKALHIHYNTVKYRINRIEQLTNIDFTDSEMLFNICLSSKVLNIMSSL